MKLQFTHGEAPLTPERIQAVETQLGRKLPDEYKRFLLKQHGGHPEPCEFEFTPPGGQGEDKDWGVVAYFLNLGDQDETLSEYLISYEDRIPRQTLPIARDPGGNPILLAVSGKNRGKVYFFMRENEPEDEEQRQEYEHLGFIANSLDAFLEALTSRP